MQRRSMGPAVNSSDSSPSSPTPHVTALASPTPSTQSLTPPAIKPSQATGFTQSTTSITPSAGAATQSCAGRSIKRTRDSAKQNEPPPPTYNAKTGVLVEPNEEVRHAIAMHKPQKGYKIHRSDIDRSFLHQWGVYEASIDEKEGSYWHCLADEKCRLLPTKIKCKNGNLSNANKHVRQSHEIEGGRSRAQKTNEKAVADGVAATKKDADPSILGMPHKRTLELQFMRLLVKEMMAFDIVAKREFRVLMRAAGGSKWEQLSPQRARHVMVEMFDATKKVVVSGLKQDLADALLRILHFSIDTWICKVSGKRYLGVHIFWVDGFFNLRHAVIAIKHYRPHPALADTQLASESLFKMLKAAIAEFDLKVEDFASCTTDSAPDVKAMCVNLASKQGVEWDWCVGHLMSKACEHAFGTSAAPAGSKNKAARDIIQRVVKVAKSLNKSPRQKAKLEDLQVEFLGDVLNVGEHTPQRWLTVINVLHRIILLWCVFRVSYPISGETFPLDAAQDEILELYSLMEPCARIMREAQSDMHPTAGKIHSLLGMLLRNTLNRNKPLKVYKIPTASDVEGKTFAGKGAVMLESHMISNDNLTEVGRVTRFELRRALVSRYYGRMYDEHIRDPSFLTEASIFLNPAYADSGIPSWLKLQDFDKAALSNNSRASAPTSDAQVKKRTNYAWTKIEDLAIQAGREQLKRAAEGPPASKRCKASANTKPPVSIHSESAKGYDDIAAELDEEQRMGATEGDPVETCVKTELKRLRELAVSRAQFPLQKVLNYWREIGRHSFPILSPVVQQVCGHQASAAQVERDFGRADLLLSGRRSRMDAYWVEMLFFLHVNFDRIPHNIPSIARKDIRKFLPKHFSGKDRDLRAAENHIDPMEECGEEDDDGLGDVKEDVDEGAGAGADGAAGMMPRAPGEASTDSGDS